MIMMVRNRCCMTIGKENAAYIAGLFDGEGCVTYKQYMRKRNGQKKAYPTWSIRMEINMTDKSLLTWVHEVLGVGTVGEKRHYSKYALGWKKQWRWRCQFRDAYFVSCLIWPWSHTKLEKIQQIINHYDPGTCGTYDGFKMNGKVVDLQTYKKMMNLE